MLVLPSHFANTDWQFPNSLYKCKFLGRVCHHPFPSHLSGNCQGILEILRSNPSNFRTDGHRGVDVGLHTLRVRRPRRVRRHPLPEAERRSRRSELSVISVRNPMILITATEHVVDIPIPCSLYKHHPYAHHQRRRYRTQLYAT